MIRDNPSLESDSEAPPSLLNTEAGPAEETSSSHPPLDTTPLHAEARPCILVVDDDSINRDLLESALESDSELLFAKDGHSALQMVRERVPDLILLDVMMPGIDGYEVCRQLKAELRTAEVPVIFMTALRNRPFITAAMEAGAAGFVLKPLDARSVRARVNKQLQLNAA